MDATVWFGGAQAFLAVLRQIQPWARLYYYIEEKQMGARTRSHA